MSDFSKKKITQSTYRPSSKSSHITDFAYIDTSLEKLALDKNQSVLFQKKITDEVTLLLKKIVSEDAVIKILEGPCLKSIFKRLGL